MDPKTLAEVKRRRTMDPRLVREEAAKEVSMFDPDYSRGDPYWYRPSMSSGYNFRPGPRDPNKPEPWCRFEDDDQSGNFDPDALDATESQMYAHLKRQREQHSPQKGDSEEVNERKHHPRTWRNGRLNGLSLPIVLKLTSGTGRQLLACGTNNWPEPEDELSPSTYEADGLQSIHEANARDPGRLPAPQILGRCGERNQNDNADIDEERVDTSEITLGHPGAKGCIRCLQLRVPCSLLQEGSKYPCQICVEDGCGCELIIQPLIKNACQGCRRREISCSYLKIGSDYTQPCRTCFAIDEKCIAGPGDGPIRMSSDQPLGDISESTSKHPRQRPTSKPFVSCTACRQDKKRCSLRPNQDPPCKRCKSANTTCDFKSLFTRANQPSSILSYPATSRLLQPVVYNYQPGKKDNTIPCHFCDDSSYAILGFRPNEASMKNISPTHICVTCTLERIQILACVGHDVQEIPNKDISNLDCDKVMYWKSANASTAGLKDDVDWEWCSLCPHEATHACCRFSALNSLTDDDKAKIIGKKDALQKGKAEEVAAKPQGCGLRLCQKCAAAVTQEPITKFKRLVKLKVGKVKNSWDKTEVRADAELLLEDGSLANLLRAGGP
ncbi:MAG: hypothetical protein Q9228_006510 [Teloschistes exilis]